MGNLLDMLEPKARRTDPETSKKAAANLKPGGIRHVILKELEVNSEHGLAMYEVADKLQVRRDIVSPHFKPLERMGLIQKTGQTRVNPETKAENNVYKVTSKYFENVISKYSVSKQVLQPGIKKCPCCQQPLPENK